MPATFGDVYDLLCERYPDPRERGRQFEPLVQKVLSTDKQYRDRYTRVWLWGEWPGRDGPDNWCDLVAEREDGGLTAFQCKCYDPSSKLYQQHLDSFLGRDDARFDELYVVSTTPNWSPNLLRKLSNRRTPVQRLDLFGLEATTIDWDAYLDDEAAPLEPLPRKEVMRHQQRALDDVLAGLRNHDRGKLIMACGTGKTFTSLRAAEELAGPGGRVLFAAPSISLVNQALRAWRADAETPIRAFAVCSDPKVGSADSDGAHIYDLPIPATTDPVKLADAAGADAPDRLTVVFSTYQSMDVIRQAQDAGMPEFDIAVCDEAHRTTGYTLKDEERSSFLRIHDGNAIRAKKRLYMTATPRLYNPSAKKKAEQADAYVASMDDAETFGPELHRLNFADSVEQRLLSDYKVAILVIGEEQIAREYQREMASGGGLPVGDVGRVVGCLNGLAKLDPEHDQFKDDPRPMQRAVAFSNTIKDSKYFVELVEALQDDAGREHRGIQVEAQHVDGKSGVLVRAERLAWLGAESMVMEGQSRILSNARCLTEGIDVPALDAVLFLKPRRSQIDVVQAVGRVMRRAEGKKYKELHANEILLLAYYIAGVNIEAAYREALADAGCEKAYDPFGGIVLTDTFQLSEEDDPMDEVFFPRNNARAERQRNLEIRVITSNPPWSTGQRAQSDLNPNQPYPTLDGSIGEAYAEPSASGLKEALYDSYVRAVRWASTRVQEARGGGIVGFVTNGSFVDGKSFDGFRKAVAKEFHEVWVYNLRGDARGSGEARKRERGNVFGGGTRTTVAVLLLVKRPEEVSKPATISYRDIGDYLSREEKLKIVDQAQIKEMDWVRIAPNDSGDWINQRTDRFMALRPLASVEGQPTGAPPIFGMSTNGLLSRRDAWVFNSSSPALHNTVERSVSFFNDQVAAFRPPSGDARSRLQAAREHATRDSTRFQWDTNSEQRLARKQPIEPNASGYRVACYRPFFEQHLYLDPSLNSRVGAFPRLFREPTDRVPGIALANLSIDDSLGVLATDKISAYHFAGADGRFFPFRTSLLAETNHPQRSLLANAAGYQGNIEIETLAAYRSRLGDDVETEQVFAYVYGVLQSPEYRDRYAADLARLLPRIPDPADRETFDAFSAVGQLLLDLHIGYQDVEPYPLDERVAGGAPPEPERYRVEKMRWAGPARNPDRSRIVYNDWLTLAGIPDEAHDYVIGPRSALGWLIDRYQVKTDKASGIVNDVNDWGLERGEPRYIVDLVKRIVTVSVETMRIVRGLPELREAD